VCVCVCACVCVSVRVSVHGMCRCVASACMFDCARAGVRNCVRLCCVENLPVLCAGWRKPVFGNACQVCQCVLISVVDSR
jgi:hypothetical protein